MYTGLLRIKYADIGSFVKSHVESGDFPEIPDYMHVTTEGSDTVNFYPQAAATLREIQNNIKTCTLFALDTIGGIHPDLGSLLKVLANNMEDGIVDQSYSMQYRYQGAPFLDIGIVKKDA